MLGQFITVIHVFICCFLILIVLLQQGRGADAGATFGGGGQTFFGASGADTLLTKVTTITAIAFMCTSILLASNIRSGTQGDGELLQMLETKPTAVETAPEGAVSTSPQVVPEAAQAPVAAGNTAASEQKIEVVVPQPNEAPAKTGAPVEATQAP